uniref:Uncharacterized protein n=1 Tax=Anguilla anguilla TaxID=7936 RepID=A0A0E9VDU7_ANGAN
MHRYNTSPVPTRHGPNSPQQPQQH